MGGAYRTARDELREHGFSTLFVDLHNTIDNVSTGHSAMALDAIEMRMDQVLCSGNPQQVRSEWHRIWTGFRALAAPRADGANGCSPPAMRTDPSSATDSLAKVLL